MPARSTLAFTSLVATLALGGCSSGLGNNLPGTTPPVAGTNANLPLGIDLGVVPTSPAVDPDLAGVVIPAIGSTPQRDVVLLAFASAAAAADADGAGTPLSRDTVTDTNGAADVFLAAVSAQDVETRAFSQSLAGKFRHPRCATCHSMAVAGTTAFTSTVEGHAGPLPGIGFPNNSPDTCAPCHVNSTQFPVPGWQAPAASFDLRSKTVAQLAEAATRVPIDETEHFVTDPRVLWALESGILPQIGGRNGRADDDHDGILEPEDSDGTPRTVPGGAQRFLQQIEAWRASGQTTSTNGAVRDVTLVSRASGGGGVVAANGASTSPRLVYVSNGSFDPTSSATAAATNPVGTVYVVFESTAANVAGTDGNGLADVYRATVELRAEEDENGNPEVGGLNLRHLAGNSVLCSAIQGTTTAGNGASTRPSIGGASGATVAFQSTSTNLIAGFTEGNGTGSDVFVRRIGSNTTLLVSHAIGGNATAGNGSSEAPSLDPTGAVVVFESDASDLIAVDGNGVRDVFFAAVTGSAPFQKTRASVTGNGSEATGGASSAASVHVDGSRVRVAYQSDATDLSTGLVAATNVFLFDSQTGGSTLLNQRISVDGSAIGDGSARTPRIAANGNTVAFASEASNIDVLRPIDGNGVADVFLVELAPLANGTVLPFRVSVSTAEGVDGDGESTAPRFAAFADTTGGFPIGAVAYPTAARNLGTTDATNLMLVFLSEASGVLAGFSASTTLGPPPLNVQFTDTSIGDPTSWQWDFEDDGTVDSTEENPAFTFTTPGTYTIRLTVANARTNDSKVETAFVRVLGPVVADFTQSGTNGAPPFGVTFTDTSTELPDSWAWDFGDGGSSTVQNPSHTYNSVGTYTVTLTATGPGGAGAVTKTDLISVSFAPPSVTVLASPTSGTAPVAVAFSLTNSGGPISSISWSFGDPGSGANTSTSATPSHTYATAGNFTVTLNVSGPGGVSSDTQGISVAAPTFTQIYGHITDGGCLSCHTTPLAGGAPFSMITKNTAYSNLVGVAATTGSCIGTSRVSAGSPNSSTIVARLEGTSCGQQMFGLTEDQITALRAWITAGAANN